MRCEASAVHEQVAKRIANVRFTNDGHIDFAEFGYYLDVMKKQQEEFDRNHSGNTILDAADKSENEDGFDSFSMNSYRRNS